jgi:hypothetical protein
MAVSTRSAVEESATSTFGVTEAWTESVLREISESQSRKLWRCSVRSQETKVFRMGIDTVGLRLRPAHIPTFWQSIQCSCLVSHVQSMCIVRGGEDESGVVVEC